jgi:predicted RNase H-like HicB family nuclease
MILKFEAYRDGEFWCARAVGESIFTQGETLDELTENIKEAVSLHFEEELEEGKEINLEKQ